MSSVKYNTKTLLFAGIHGHTRTQSSPMNERLDVNTVYRTLNAHDIFTIGEMY